MDFDKVKLLLHLDSGAVTTDSSNDPKTIIQYNTVPEITGVFSGGIDCGAGYLYTTYHSDYDFGTNDFTIDLRIRLSSTSIRQGLLSTADPGTTHTGWNLEFSNVVGLRFIQDDTVVVSQASSAGWSTGVWYHIAIVRSGNTFSLYRDGNLLTSDTFSGAINANLDRYLRIGATGTTALTYAEYTGDFDEIRIVNGEAAWTGEFTPPEEPYPLSTISGYTNIGNVRVLILNESDWSLESNTVLENSGNYSIDCGLGTKTVVAITSDESPIVKGNITPSS